MASKSVTTTFDLQKALVKLNDDRHRCIELINRKELPNELRQHIFSYVFMPANKWTVCPDDKALHRVMDRMLCGLGTAQDVAIAKKAWWKTVIFTTTVPLGNPSQDFRPLLKRDVLAAQASISRIDKQVQHYQIDIETLAFLWQPLNATAVDFKAFVENIGASPFAHLVRIHSVLRQLAPELPALVQYLSSLRTLVIDIRFISTEQWRTLSGAAVPYEARALLRRTDFGDQLTSIINALRDLTATTHLRRGGIFISFGLPGVPDEDSWIDATRVDPQCIVQSLLNFGGHAVWV